MPVPKISCQKRLTVTRAVSGFSGLDDPLREAEPVLAARPAAADCRKRGRAGLDLSPFLSYWPRIRM